MKLDCQIIIKEELDLIEKVFEAEDKEFKRSGYSLKRTDDSIIINIYAQDPTALRATITSVTRILNIVRKTNG